MRNQGQHALLIGITSYRYAPLKGCENDVQRMRGLLRERCGFAETDIAVLLNEQATRDNILAGLERLISHADRDDRVVVYYAGHGRRIRDREGTKPSQYDETLVPIDSFPELQNRDITDDEIRLWMLRLTERTRYITLVFDCCHSATLVRDQFGDGERGLPPDRTPIDALPPSPIPQSARALLAGHDPRCAWLPAGDHYVYMGACRDEETARETAQPHPSGTGTIHFGLFTYHLIEAAGRLTPTTTYHDLFQRAALAVSDVNPRQNPVCEGARDRVAFGCTQLPATQYQWVTRVEGSRIWLTGGRPAGVTVGSEWELLPPDTPEFAASEGPRSRFEIVAADAVAAQALRIGGPLDAAAEVALQRGAQARLVSQPIDARWPVEIVGIESPPAGQPEASLAQKIFTCLAESIWLRRAAAEEPARARVYLLPPRTRDQPSDSVPQLLEISEPTWAVVGRDGALCMRPMKAYQPRRVVENLSKLARQSFIRTLRNPSSALDGKVSLRVLLRPPRAGALERDAGLPDGTIFDLEVENQHDQPLYIHVLLLDAEGGVSLLYPPAGGIGELAGSHRCLLPAPQPWQFRFPAEPLQGLRPDGTIPDEVTVHLVLIATSTPIDVQPLCQEAMRALPDLPQGIDLPLGKLLRKVLSTARANLGGALPGTAEEWVTEAYAQRILRRIEMSTLR